MQIQAYLNFPGTCQEAFTFYAKVLDAKITAMMPHTETPMADQTPEGWQSKIMHARLEKGDAVIMASDAPPDYFDAPKGFSVSITVTDVAEAERVFAELAEGGTVRMAVQETFWALRFGMLVDRYGIPWMVNCYKPT